jgi:membrane peptidoglycan carboxypeptidase|tara:strand:+ start:10055 stop:11677 length:1623 start_codon:yes stop_codon:yes gene_type:complete
MSWSSSHRESRWTESKRFLKRFWEFAWKSTLTLLVPALLAIGWYAYQASKYDLSKIEQMPARTILVGRKGVEFGTIHGENRRLVEHDEIPEFLKTCLFAREDSRFLEHEGVDFMGLARATLRNLKDLDFTQGASTLSMQLARNTYDLREKKSLNRKFLEIALTYRVEAIFPKEEILTHYLNRIYFGAGCNGIEEAALTYFGIPTSQLNQGQSALLVGIIRAPHACSPWRNLEGAIKQRDEVLARLVTTEAISQAQADRIKDTSLNLRDRNSDRVETSHGARVLRRPLEIVLNNTQVTTGGLRVVTSIDFELQQGIEKLIQETPLPTGCQMAALALDPRNGDILAVVGCREKNPTGFNRALDSHRDLGPDLIEPLLGTIALERGHLPIKGNLVTTGRQLEEQDARQLLKRFGFEGTFGSGDDLYRGTISVSLLELATAYATIIQHGSRPTPVFVRELLHEEKTLFRRPPSFFPAFSPHSRLNSIPRLLSGRSLPKCDLWAAALGKEKVIVVWIGYDKPRLLEFEEGVTKGLREKLENLLRQ